MGGFRADHPMNDLTERIIGAAMYVHTALGPGLLESTYEACLAYALRKRGHEVTTQVPRPVIFEGLKLDCGYRLDMLVDRQVVVELKVVKALAPVHVSQVLTYLRLSQLEVGLLFNFNVKRLADGGFKRILLEQGA